MFGDFNMHFEISDDPSVVKFKCLIDEHFLHQCVHETTHVKGHTLDLCLYRCADTAFSEFPVVEDICLSDHFVITASLPFSKPKNVKQSIKSRNIKNIDLSCFQLALNESLLEIKTK